jgi:N-acetyl-alpha-D-muramate 1-phosphate uridylyltransferase
MIKQAIILAAGRGARFRPITDSIPKPLVQLQGKSLIDWQLELLAAAGVERVIINCCYLKELLIEHVRSQNHGIKELAFSEEDIALETGGGIKKALPFFAGEPFFALNSDVVIAPTNAHTLHQLASAFTRQPQLQAALLLQPNAGIIGLNSQGDFFCDEYGRLNRRSNAKENREVAPFVFTGVQLLAPAIFADIEASIFSMNLIYDAMLQQSPNNIAGIINTQGKMLHVGDVEGHKSAEQFLIKR